MIKIIESKQLNEGPGAGYTIKGTIENVKVNSAKKTGEHSDDYGTYVDFDLEATADFEDVSCESYMYGGTVDSTPISIYSVSVEKYKDEEMSEEDVAELINGTKIDVILGGGWTHSTFDGDVNTDYRGIEGSSSVDSIGFELTNKNAIEFIDSAVQAPEEYFGLVDEDDVIEDAYEDEDKAIELAKKHGYDKVVRFNEYRNHLFADNESEDYDQEIIETVWEREDESLKESKDNKHITKVTKDQLKEEVSEKDYSDEDQEALDDIFSSLNNGVRFGQDMDNLTYPLFWWVMEKGVSGGHDIIRYRHYGQSAVRFTKKDLVWLLNTIFKMTPTQFLDKFIRDKDSKYQEKNESKENFDNNKKCLNKKCDRKELNETFAGEDVISDLVDRAKGWMRDGSDIEEAIETSIDDGLIYTEDIINLAEHYGYFDADRASEMISFFYDDLRSDMEEKLKETDDDVDESLKALDGFGIANLFKK